MNDQMTSAAIEIRGKMLGDWVDNGESIEQIEAWADDPICKMLINQTAQRKADEMDRNQEAITMTAQDQAIATKKCAICKRALSEATGYYHIIAYSQARARDIRKPVCYGCGDHFTHAAFVVENIIRAEDAELGHRS